MFTKTFIRWSASAAFLASLSGCSDFLSASSNSWNSYYTGQDDRSVEMGVAYYVSRGMDDNHRLPTEYGQDYFYSANAAVYRENVIRSNP